MAADKRTRTGCVTCRKRRVKCDEAKPICNRCRTANYACEGYAAPRRAGTPTSPSSSASPPETKAILISSHSSRSPRQSSPLDDKSGIPEISYRHANWQQEQLPLYHHFVTTTVVRLFRSDHVSFWRDQVAQMSFSKDIVYEALLAIGAVHRASLLACQEGNLGEAMKFRVLGLGAYGNAIRLLSSMLKKKTETDRFAVLVVLMLLTYFECFMENAKGALHHLWAAIKLLRESERQLSDKEVSNMVPLYDAMIRLDFLAQKLVPYACSSFLRCSDIALMESPFWNRPSPEFSSLSSDSIAAERYLLIQLICAHNKLSRVVWGCWCPTDERPTREELMGFYSEMLLWKATSPATLAAWDVLDRNMQSIDFTDLEALPIPPPPYYFADSETAMNVAMYNGYLGCALAMINTTDEDTAARELEIFKIVYQNLCITAGLIESDNVKEAGIPYKPCDAISMGISTFLFHGARRCFSVAWQKWTIAALRSIGREGLSNGFTSANTLEIICQLQARMNQNKMKQEDSYLGPICERLIPLLVPRGEDGQNLAFFLRYGSTDEADGNEQLMQVVARATWQQDIRGQMMGLKLVVYDSAIDGNPSFLDKPKAEELFSSWRIAVEQGWHGFLEKDVQEGFLQRERLSNL